MLMCITPPHGSHLVLGPLESQERREVVVIDAREYQLSLADKYLKEAITNISDKRTLTS